MATVAAATLAGCDGRLPPLLSPSGPVAGETRNLFFISVGLMLLVVLPVFVLTAIIVWRYRAKAGAKYTPDWAASRPFEIALWTLPLVIVAILGVLVWFRTHDLDPYKPVAGTAPPLTVQVVALDWKWLFIYPEQHIASVNRLVFPVGAPLTLKLTSDTVMNALVVPALGGQIYAMAGMETQLNLLADKPGNFDGHNTQFSGAGFPQDRFVAQAVTADEFAGFVATARKSGQALDAVTYERLAKPSRGAPDALYGSVDGRLFDSIMAKYANVLPPRSATTAAVAP